MASEALEPRAAEFDLIPRNWRVVPLSACGEISGGGTPRKSVPAFWDGDIPWVSPKDFKGPEILDSEDHISDAAIRDSSTTLVPDGSILIVVRSGILRHRLPIAIARRPVAINQDLKALVPSEEVDGDYVLAFLIANEERIRARCMKTGTTVESIGADNLAQFEVTLPPLPEQRKIAASLSSVDDAIATTRKVIAQTKRVKHGLLQTLMTRGIGHTRFKKTEIGEIPEAWKVVPFASLVQDRVLGTPERGRADNGNYLLIKMGNLTWGGFNLSEVETVKGAPHLKALELQPGDLLFNTRNTPELVGKTAVWQEAGTVAVPDNNIMRVRLHNRILPNFLCGQMTYGRGRAQLRRIAAGSTSVAAIYWKDLSKYRVALPPLDEQGTMCQLLGEADQVIEKSELFLSSISSLKRGLMQDLLTGRVRVPLD